MYNKNYEHLIYLILHQKHYCKIKSSSIKILNKLDEIDFSGK